MDGPITVERLKCCDWSVHKFIEVNFSKLTDSNGIFRIDFVGIHYHPGEISCQKCSAKFIGPYERPITYYYYYYFKSLTSYDATKEIQ